MAIVAPQPGIITGTVPTYTAASSVSSDSDQVPAGSLLIVRTSGTATTLNIVTPTTQDPVGIVIPDQTIVFGATQERWIRLLPYDLYRNVTDGLVHIGWTSITGVTFAVIS